MIAEITRSITEKMPNANVTWWREGDPDTWFFRVSVVDGCIVGFRSSPQCLLPGLLSKKSPELVKAQAEEIAMLIYFDWQQATGKSPMNRQTETRLYAIYDHPTDFPGHWVVRGWENIKGLLEPQPDAEPILCESVEEARDHIRNLLPFALLITIDDPDPNLAEVWGSGE